MGEQRSKGVKANKYVIVFALATAAFCVLSLSLKLKTTVVVDKYHQAVDRLSTLKDRSSQGADLSLLDLESGDQPPEATGFEAEELKRKGKPKDKPKVERTEASKGKGKGKGKDKEKKKKTSKSEPEPAVPVPEPVPEPVPVPTTKEAEIPSSHEALKEAAEAAKDKIVEEKAKKAEEVKKNKSKVLEKLSKVKPAPKSAKKSDEPQEKLTTSKGKTINALAAYGTHSVRDEFKCGKMPESFLPKFTEQKIKKGGSRRYIAKNGYVSPMNVHKKVTRAKTENGRRRARIERATGRLKDGEGPLIKCLQNLGKCDNKTMALARSLDGMGTILTTRNAMLKKTYKTCALVGNSGAMKEKKYGKYIDEHDFVARVNALPTRKFEENLGNKTSLRVMSFKISKDVCCFRKNYKPDNKQLQFLIWFPASRSDILKQMRKKYPTNPSSVMPTPFLSTAVGVFKTLRKDLLRLGYGPFEEWEYMTSGMHAVLGLVQSCSVVNLYGFTTDVSTKGPYWFTGRRQPPRSGRTQHAWDHERMVLRSLFAAGLINICTP
ncbi:sialyltransferase [Chloropicon primus]|uniref:Sialyltransferase n=1 Tax=Chloropicon primus TaxID=1764295 RepID=A0A5B8MLP8_9CHLO|nr:sialyltransferase [Chloropicon primus]UPR00144.1 sialyltransferase [Chloropicon primus]|eukprot:QDZ20934.1 sialyltransferase [Chloropicon primus]